jgi:hypothetical protein
MYIYIYIYITDAITYVGARDSPCRVCLQKLTDIQHVYRIVTVA